MRFELPSLPGGSAGLRAELRAFLAEAGRDWTPAVRARSWMGFDRDFSRELGARGWIGMVWPKAYGGHERSGLERVVVLEELLAVGAPVGAHWIGDRQSGPLILRRGTEEQRRKILPGIASGKLAFCIGLSEPEAGSDLAALRTKAVPDDAGAPEVYRVNGQKVWTTDGHWAQFGYLLARTDAGAPKHKGISAFICDMCAPGVTVRPLRELTGTSDFNEVFLDDVEIPAANMIGAPGQGWVIANSTLAHERGSVGAIVVKLRLAIEALTDLAGRVRIAGRPALDSDRIRDQIGMFTSAVDALSALTYANITRWTRGTERSHDAAMAKLMFSELNLAIATFAVELAGEDGVLVGGDPRVPDGGRWQDEWLYARAYTIAGGSSEIMRNLIAERGLGLPR